jgi:hypothetical protein
MKQTSLEEKRWKWNCLEEKPIKSQKVLISRILKDNGIITIFTMNIKGEKKYSL